jgi:DNA-binding NarL/FixJ family response regulator
MAGWRVVVIDEGSLYSQGVIRFLEEQPDMRVLVADRRATGALDGLLDPWPDAVIVFSLRDAARLRGLKGPLGKAGLRIIWAGLENAELEVYRAEGAAEASPQRLLAAIRAPHGRNRGSQELIP